MESIPRDLRNLRACLLCGLVKAFDQFESDGCENCERLLQLKGDRDRVYECTSSNFDGMVSMMAAEESWVAKWLKIRKQRGVYALSVSGSLPDNVLQDLRDMGLAAKPSMRDCSVR